MAHPNVKPEASKKPSVSASIEALIAKKKTEAGGKVPEAIASQTKGVQEGVAEVMAGVEKPKETVSERKGEGGQQGDLKAGTASAGDQSQATSITIQDYIFPSEEIMIKKIRTAIGAQIKAEWKRAKAFQGKLDSGGAQQYNDSIARIRSLKEILNSLVNMTMNFLKDMYVKYFTPEGHRRAPKD